MAVKTITIELDAYELLKSWKQSEKESFSQVIRRVVPRKGGIQAGDILRMVEDGTYPLLNLTDEEIRSIEQIDHQFLPEEFE